MDIKSLLAASFLHVIDNENEHLTANFTPSVIAEIAEKEGDAELASLMRDCAEAADDVDSAVNQYEFNDSYTKYEGLAEKIEKYI